MRLPLLLGAAALAAAATARASSAGDVSDPGPPAEVRLVTADGMTLAARSWDEPSPGCASAVLLHGDDDGDGAWLPLVRALRAREVEVLSVDLRGRGGSATQHGIRVGDDPSLLREMHADVEGAVGWLVRESRCAPKRVAVIGAGAAALVAVDAAARTRVPAAAAVMVRPPVAAEGLDGGALLRRLPAGTAVLALAEGSTADPAPLEVGKVRVRAVVLSEPLFRARRGDDVTTWWNAVGPGIAPALVASFVAARTGSTRDDVVLDGLVAEKGPDADPWRRAVAVSAGPGEAWAYRVGARIQYGGIVRQPVRFAVVEVEHGTADGVAHPAFTDSAEIDLHTGQVGATTWRGRHGPPEDAREATAREARAVLARICRLRTVRSGATTTFEGEWELDTVPLAADVVRVRVLFTSDTLEQRSTWVEVPERSVLPSR